MGFFSGKKPSVAPTGGGVQGPGARLVIGFFSLVRGDRSRRHRFAPQGTGLFEDLPVAKVEEPTVTAPASMVGETDLTIARIRDAYESSGCQFAVDVTPAEVDAVFATGQLDLLKYCATHASDTAVQRHAVQRLAEAHRFYDLLDVAEDTVGEGSKHKKQILALFEQHVDAITGGDFTQTDETRDVQHILDFVLENTRNVDVARELVGFAQREGFVEDLPLITREEDVFEMIADTLAEEKKWAQLCSHAMYLFGMCHTEKWKYMVRVIESNADDIIQACTTGNLRDEKSILPYLGENTFSYDIGTRVIDALEEKGNYPGITKIAKSAKKEHEVKSMSGRIVERVPRENAVAIAKYAVDRLANEGKTAELREVAAVAHLHEVQLYAQLKLTA